MARPKGSPNKKSLLMKSTLEEYECDPVRGLLECIRELELITCYEAEDRIQLVKSKANIYAELIQYIYPKRKAIEVSGQLETFNQVVHIEWQDDHDTPNAQKDTAPEEDLAVN